MNLILIFIGLLGLAVLWLWQGRHAVRATIVGAVGIVAILGVGLFAPWLVGLSPPVPSGQLVGWMLGQDYGRLQFDPATAQTTTMIPMVVDHPSWVHERDWLGEPVIAYTPWSVTITMHARDNDPDPSKVGLVLSGMNTLVELREPLGGRQLFDGSKSPPHPRSPGDAPSLFSR